MADITPINTKLLDMHPIDTKSRNKQMIREFGITEDQYWDKMSLSVTDFISDKEMYQLLDEYMLSRSWNISS
jgi:hypothetical protein